MAARGVRALLDLDGRSVATLRRLVAEPGALVREYAQGRFVRQVSPMRLYLAVAAVYFFLGPYLGGGIVRFLAPGGQAAWFSFGPLTWDSELLLLVLIPLWAVAVRLLLPGQRRPLEEVFVFSVHYQVFFLLVMSAAGLLAAALIRLGLQAVAPPLLVLGLLIPVLYLYRALRVAFGYSGIVGALLTAAFFLLHLGGGQLLQKLT